MVDHDPVDHGPIPIDHTLTIKRTHSRPLIEYYYPLDCRAAIRLLRGSTATGIPDGESSGRVQELQQSCLYGFP